MAGSLIKLDEKIASNDASITLGGAKWDSSYDVYMVQVKDVLPTTDNVKLTARVTESSTPNTTANYDFANKVLKTFSAFDNDSATNQTAWELTDQELGTGTQETGYGTIYIFNANNSAEYTFITNEMICRDDNGNLFGNQGGGVFTSSSLVNGIQFYMASGNIDTGSSFVLYGLKK